MWLVVRRLLSRQPNTYNESGTLEKHEDVVCEHVALLRFCALMFSLYAVKKGASNDDPE